MFSRNRTPKPEPTPEELREKALDRLHAMAVFGRINLPGLGVSHRPSTFKAHLRAGCLRRRVGGNCRAGRPPRLGRQGRR